MFNVAQSAKMADKGTTKNVNMQAKRRKTRFYRYFSRFSKLR